MGLCKKPQGSPWQPVPPNEGSGILFIQPLQIIYHLDKPSIMKYQSCYFMRFFAYSGLRPVVRISILIFLFLYIPNSLLWGQKFLQIEKSGSLRTQKIPVGEVLTYRLEDDETWYTGEIVRLLPEDSIVLFHNRFVGVGQIKAFRYARRAPASLSQSLFWFGLGWSALAIVGTATDDVGKLGVPDYRWSDAAVTGTSVGTSWLLPRLFKYRYVRFGQKKRLRILDLDPLG